ncbi:MAG: rubredoxin [Eubacteriaceae bacterium]
MQKYICNICGFIYDESTGNAETGISSGTKWEDMPKDWICPLCSAAKDEFTEEKINSIPITPELPMESNNEEQMKELSFGELSVLCSNLSKGCEKQYRMEESDLFNQLSEYFKDKRTSFEEKQLSDLTALLQQDLDSTYSQANQIAAKAADRGSLRALTWGEKVTKILSSLLNRYEKQQDTLLENTSVYVCEICGFLYIGEKVPDICPICKVPNTKLTQIKRG